MISPTGQGLRQADKWGMGAYGASRKKGKTIHLGADYICEPGQNVVAPITGIIARESRPYGDPEWLYRYSGLVMYNEHVSLKLFYLEPMRQFIGTRVRMGDIIGIAQKISDRYPGMTDHIHLQIDSVNPEIFMGMI